MADSGTSDVVVKRTRRASTSVGAVEGDEGRGWFCNLCCFVLVFSLLGAGAFGAREYWKLDDYR